jgi:hypothetical protein
MINCGQYLKLWLKNLKCEDKTCTKPSLNETQFEFYVNELAFRLPSYLFADHSGRAYSKR